MKKTSNFAIISLLTAGALFFFPSTGYLYGQAGIPEKTAEVTTKTKDIKGVTTAEKKEKESASAVVDEKKPEKEEVQAEGSSLFATVKQGGPLMVFLVILALASLTIIVERLIFYTRNQVWKNDNVDALISTARQGSTASYREDLEDELRGFYQIYVNGVERGMALLSGIGNIAPIVGFLGTVIGMIKAFASIAAATTVNAKVVAVGIQIALVTTAGGLLVAAPTLAFYYLFTHVLQNRYARMEELITGAIDEMPRLSDRLCEEGINER